MSKNIFKDLFTGDVSFYTEYDSNRSYCQGDCEDYCRCTSVSPKITSIYYDSFLSRITTIAKQHKLNLSEIQIYCLDRLLHRTLDTDDSFDCHGVPGYYGEDVSITLLSGVQSELTNNIKTISELSDVEAIEFILMFEYDSILDTLKNKSWKIIKDVPIKNIRLPYMSKINKELSKYDGTETILCAQLDDQHYQLIDGRHRYQAAIKNKRTTMNVLVAYER